MIIFVSRYESDKMSIYASIDLAYLILKTEEFLKGQDVKYIIDPVILITEKIKN
jgi:hypothetical protein